MGGRAVVDRPAPAVHEHRRARGRSGRPTCRVYRSTGKLSARLSVARERSAKLREPARQRFGKVPEDGVAVCGGECCHRFAVGHGAGHALGELERSGSSISNQARDNKAAVDVGYGDAVQTHAFHASPIVRRKRSAIGLADPFQSPPQPLLQENSTQLGELVGAVNEHLENLVPFGDVEREHHRFAVVGSLEPLGGVVEASVPELAGHREDESVFYGYASKEHSSSVHLFVLSRKSPAGPWVYLNIASFSRWRQSGQIPWEQRMSRASTLRSVSISSPAAIHSRMLTRSHHAQMMILVSTADHRSFGLHGKRGRGKWCPPVGVRKAGHLFVSPRECPKPTGARGGGAPAASHRAPQGRKGTEPQETEHPATEPLRGQPTNSPVVPCIAGWPHRPQYPRGGAS